MAKVFEVGIGRADITPPVGIAHGGWGAQLHDRAAGIDHPMLATVLWVGDGDGQAAICDLDLGSVTEVQARAMREDIGAALDIDPASVRVSYSHTHAGPMLPRDGGPEVSYVAEGQELVDGYLAQVRIQIVGAARAARAAAQPARLAAGYGSCDIGVNRRFRHPDDGRILVGENPRGYSDQTVTVVRFDSLEGKTIAALVGYAAHPITLAFQNQLVSPDYPGFARLWLERMVGAPTIFLQGCAGDQMAMGGLTGDTSQPRILGKRLAAASAAVLLSLRSDRTERRFSHVVESGAPLAMMIDVPADTGDVRVRAMSERVTMPLRSLPTVDEAESRVQDSLEALREAKQRGTDADVAAARFRAKRAAFGLSWARMASGRDDVDVELHAIRIGHVGLVGFPGEPFARIGHEVRESSPFAVTQMAGYTNGWLGYVPTDEELALGGYEVDISSPYGKGAAAALRDGALDLLAALADD